MPNPQPQSKPQPPPLNTSLVIHQPKLTLWSLEIRMEHYKARLVATRSSQQVSIDSDETFSPVVKPATICTVLSIAFTRHWHIHELDVKNAFLNALLQKIILSLHKEFDMKDLGALNYFLGIFVTRDSTWMFLSQIKYAMQLLEREHILNCNLTRTPVDTESKLGPEGICLYMHDPREPHLDALKGILCYVQGTLEFGITNVVAKTTWLHNLLQELHIPLLTTTLVYYGNVSDVYLSANQVQHQRTKHIEINIHFVRDMVAMGYVRVLHVPSRYPYADIFTKGLPSALVENFRTSLSVRSPPAQTAGEC
ncbi:ribonuclease H-like domain-containing protein [Tanacetum coccineum]